MSEMLEQGIYSSMRGIWELDKEDKMIIELLISTYLSRKQTNEKIFLIYVAPSGSGKTELFKLFDDSKQNTYFIDKFTKASLSSGMLKRNKITGESYDPSLAPRLKDKVVIVPDMAKLTTSSDKEALWSEFIGLFDGNIRENFGNGKVCEFNNLNVTLMCGATPSIYSQMLMTQHLGTRFLFFNRKGRDLDKVLEKSFENSSKDMNKESNELKDVFLKFLGSLNYVNEEPDKDAFEVIKNWALISSNLRASAKVELSTGQLIEPITIECPSRLFKQFIVLYKGLMSIGKDYTKERALKIIGKLALSNANPNRIEVLKALIEYKNLHEEGFSRRDVAQYLRISDKVCLGELNSLYNLGFLKRIEKIVDTNKDERWYRFIVDNKNPNVTFFAEYFELSDYLGLEIEVKKI